MTNKLFPIPLSGLGTADVESFASYIHRCAKIHGVHVGVLLRHVQMEAHSDDQLKDLGNWSLPAYIRPEEMIRPNALALNLVNSMSHFSKQSLGHGVLWFLSSVLGRSTGEICEGFRWCPECLAETAAVGGAAYFKLIWHLKDIDCCPTHRAPLVSACPMCGCDQTSYRKTAALNVCQDCGSNLAKRVKKLKQSDINNSWEISGFDLVTLFDDLAGREPNFLPVNGVQLSLEKLFDYYWSQDRENELYRVLPRDKLLSAIHGTRPISLKLTRRFAYCMGLSLFDIMSGNAVQTTAVNNLTWFCSLPPSFIRAATREKRDHKATLKRIRRYIEKCEIPPSLKQVAKETGLSVGYIEYRYPVLTKTIVNEHANHVTREKLIRRYKAQEAALKYFCDAPVLSVVSRKKAYKDLRRDTGLPKFLLKSAIQTAYVAMYGSV
ncbi:MAG: TniQ family protein [Gammaproteobacteria bacterium]